MRLRLGLDLGLVNDNSAIVVCAMTQSDVGGGGGAPMDPSSVNPLSPLGIALSGQADAMLPVGTTVGAPASAVEMLARMRPRTAEQDNLARRLPADEPMYVARRVERIPLRTSYFDVAVRVRVVLEGLRKREPDVVPELYVDSTGVGIPVIDILRRELVSIPHRLVPVTIVSGEGYRDAAMADGSGASTLPGRPGVKRAPARGLSVGKAFLVSRLQALLQMGRLRLPQTEEARVLQEQLRDFQLRAHVTHDEYGGKSGTHDDLVIAGALAVLDRPRRDARAVADLNAGMVDPGRVGFGGPRNAWDLPRG